MNLRNPTVATARRSSLALALLTAIVLLGSPAARASGPRPLFQMPFPCGQTWEASTYEGHWPDEDSVDFAERTAGGENMSEGEPVLASAAGTVLDVLTSPGGDHRVYLDHGGGWVTHYIHLESVPPLAVGQSVAQGEQIGRTGNSGTEAMHLHYSQLHDGEAVRISFNGALMGTHAGDEDSYGTWGTDAAEKLTSLNCPGNAFMGFDQNGMRYELLYKPGTGTAKILRVEADGTGVTTTWSGTWTKGWTHLTPFSLAGGQQHAFLYKSSSGQVKFLRMKSAGAGVTTLSAGTWGGGWTHFVPFSLGGHPYFIAYDSLHGYVNVDRITPEGNSSTTLAQGTWTKGWTQLVPFDHNGNKYLLLYKGGTGAVKILEITGGGDDVELAEAWSGTWTTGWTSLVPLSHAGARYLLGYKAATGRAAVLKVKAHAQGVQIVSDGTWTTPWTALSPLLLGGEGAVLLYKAGTGAVKTVKLNAGGAGTTTVWTGSWTLGWA